MIPDSRNRDIRVLEHDRNKFCRDTILVAKAGRLKKDQDAIATASATRLHSKRLLVMAQEPSGTTRGCADGTAEICTNIGYHDALRSGLIRWP
jgi:hypothetical protein